MAGAKPSTHPADSETILCYVHPDCAHFDIVRNGIVYRVTPHRKNYRVGENGTVWSLKIGKVKGGAYWRRVRPSVHSGGYLQVHFYNNYERKPMFIHRLVLETFIGPCPEGMEACHNNGDRTDNRIGNLRWDSRKNNHADKVGHGTLLMGSGIGNSKLKEDQIPIICALSKAGVFQWQIAQAFGVTQGDIGMIISGKIWQHIQDDETREN